MKKIYFLALMIFAFSKSVCAQSVVVNKFFNHGTTVGLDVIELLVITDFLDMRGMIIKDYSSSMGSDGGGKATFSTNALWTSVRSGTIIIIRNNTTEADVSLGTANSGDFTVDVGITNTTYFTGGSLFDISTTEMVQIKSSGSGTAGVTGAIHTLGAGTAGSNYTASGTPKLISSSTSGSLTFAFANNTNSVVGDFNGTNASASTSGITFGSGNTAANTTYINSLRNAAALPISLLSFQAKKLSETVQLTWATASEIRNERFSIERSQNATDFEEIASIDGAGDSHSILNYSFIDENPLKGTAYYRLKQYDFNGASETFKTIAVSNGKGSLSIEKAYTNAETIHLSVYSPIPAESTLQVYDLSGRLLRSENYTLAEGYNNIQLNNTNLQPGIHLIKLKDSENTVMKKFIY